MNDQPSIARRVVGTIGVNATMLNAGILVLCGWYIGTKQTIPDLLLGALIANASNAVGSLSSVLNSTKSMSETQDVKVVNRPDEEVPVVDAGAGG